MSNLDHLMHPTWAEALAPLADKVAEMGQMLRQELSEGRHYLPGGKDIFRAFTYPLPAVKVLLLGQDPYPTPGHAMGLSFSVQPGVELPRSLVNIYKELEDDLGIPPANTGDLRPWCDQGVMLLNRVLSVQPHEAGSHRGKGWEEITEYAIKVLVERQQPLVAILWGNDSRKLAPLFQDRPYTYCIESAHPSPLSASRGFFGSKPFSRTNMALQSFGLSPIDWRLGQSPVETMIE